jgi:tRNA (guanine26-N2/guanine27-N2)-dimethyltransferase
MHLKVFRQIHPAGETRNQLLDLPKRSHLIEALQNQGFSAAATHIDPQGIKTDAKLENIIAIARNLHSKSE